MKLPDDSGTPLEHLFEWFRIESRKISHGTVYLEIDIHEGKIIGANKGSKKQERFPLQAKK